MAFVSQTSPDQDPNQQGQPNQQANQAPVTSAPNAGGSSGKASTGQPSSSAAAQPFANLSTYLTANAPQIGAEAGQIASGLTSGYTAATGAIDQAGQNFGNDVKAGYTPNDPNVISSFQTSPTAVANDPTQSAAFKGMYNDQYTGPSSFENSSYYAPLSSQVQQGQATAAQVGTVPGLQSYLSKDNPNYTLGQSTLDSVLLQGNPDAVNTIQAAATPYANLPSYLSSAVTTGNAAAQKANQDAQAAKAAAQAAYTGVANPFAKSLTDNLQSTTQKSVDYNTGLNDIAGKVGRSDFKSLTPAQQAEIGFNPSLIELMDQYPSIFPSQAANHPIDFSKYFTQGAQAAVPNASDTVTPDQIAEFQALQSLSGVRPGVGFDMPTTSTADSFHQFAGAQPSYNGQGAGTAIEMAYGPMYDALARVGDAPQNVQDYMNKVNSFLTQPQNAPLPTTPQPAPGSPGDLGAGFHWDTATGSWQPTIPLAPPGGQTNPGGGHHTF